MTRETPKIKYSNWIAGLLVLLIVVDLVLIGWRKYQTTPIIEIGGGTDFKFQFDPNTATADEMEYLPGLNRQLAEAIVAYRKDLKRHYPERIAFKNRDDLTRIKGISEKRLSQAEDFLIFPSENNIPFANPGDHEKHDDQR
jgi:preprotein translocase subunit SecF